MTADVRSASARLAVVAGGLVLLLSCADGKEADADVCVHDPPLTYDNFGRKFLHQYCTGCHGSQVPEDYRNEAPLDSNFDTWQGVLENARSIEVQTDPDAPLMPPGGGPRADEYQDLQEWLQCEVLPATEAS